MKGGDYVEFKVHIEDHRDLLLGGTLAIIGISCLVFTKRVIVQRLDKVKSDIEDTLKRSIELITP